MNWRIRPNDLRLTVENEHGDTVAIPCSSATTSAPETANLIAAAPDLLDALQRLVNGHSIADEAIGRAAITKATGKAAQ